MLNADQVLRMRASGSAMMMSDSVRKIYGVFETPTYIFRGYILPRIREVLYDYVWVDLFAGTGNLILPILESIPMRERLEFFEERIFLYDIMPEMVEKAIENAVRMGIPRRLAERNIQVRDTLKSYPREVLEKGFPVYHITNPPYLYIGYIRKNRDYHVWLDYFKNSNEGYQDLYQLALANDLRHGIRRMAYVIPTNFLYGASVSNKIRRDLLLWYEIREAIVFEKRIFDFTGQHVGVFFFERKEQPSHDLQKFKLVKIGREVVERVITIKPSNMYRAGSEFSEFVEGFRARKPLKVSFYLFLEEIMRNPGSNKVIVVDSNRYDRVRGYAREVFYVNDELFKRIKSNILFVKTIDGVREDEKAGVFVIKEVFNADCIVVSRKPYRTHPIHIFFHPMLSIEDQLLLRDYFNLMLNYFREVTDSGFMTTYKYSETSFTRKYLGLTQVRKLIETFPILELDERGRNRLKELIERRDVKGLIDTLKSLST